MLLMTSLAILCLAGSVTPQGTLAEAPPRPRPPPPRPAEGPVRRPPPPGPGIRCQAAFSVRKADTRRTALGGKVVFHDILANTGGWHHFSNEYEAPCSGHYFFSFHAMSPERGDFTIALIRGNRYQVTAYGSSSGFQQGSNSAVLYLNRGDRVHLQLQQGFIYEHPFNEAYTSFSGFIVD